MQKNKLSCESHSALVKQKERRIVTWTSEEDDILRQQISGHGTDNWTVIASRFNNKTARQCRRRWCTYLNSDFKRGGWTPEEDILLCEAQKIFGNRWTEIAKVVSGRTDNAVKNRFTTLCKKRAKTQELAKENNTNYMNANNKRALSNTNGLHFEGSMDSAFIVKKLRAAHIPNLSESRKVEDNSKLDNLPPLNQGNVKSEGTFLKKDDPKVLALLQQAELLSSLATKVNTENNAQKSLDNAWKVLENFLNENKVKEVLKSTIFEKDLQLYHLKDLVEELASENEEIQHSSQRQPDLYDSPSSSEYSNGSTTSTNASEQMEQIQPNICIHDNAQAVLQMQTIDANGENTQSSPDNKILAKKQEEISVPFLEAEIDEDVSALLIAEFSSPVQITPLFRSSPATIPSPQFSESERHFLMKTLGIESPAPSKTTNPSQSPLCRRALIHSL